MTHYINELADMVPQCAALGRKPDKLTILRMAVSHMKSIRTSSAASNDMKGLASCQPSFLTDQELKHLIMEAANGFLFVVSCENARVLYVSDSIYPILNVTQGEWLDHALYDLVHPVDVSKIQDQLSITDAAMTRTIDLKTGTVKRDQSSTRIHLNCRRGFICRMRIGNLDLLPRLRNRAQIFEDAGKFYAVVHCSGYVKSSPPIGIQSIGPQSTNACLVAIARLQLMSVNSQICNSTQFTLRADKEGFITYVDQKAQELLHKPISEILGKHLWMLVHSMDEQLVVDAFKSMTQKNQQQVKNLSCKLHCQNKQSEYIAASMDIGAFVNPHSREFEFVIATVNLQQDQTEESLTNCQQKRDNNYPIYFEGQFNEHKNPADQEVHWPIVAPNDVQQQLEQQQPSFVSPLINGAYLPGTNSLLLSHQMEQQPQQQQQWPSVLINARTLPDFSNMTTANSSMIWPEQHDFLQ